MSDQRKEITPADKLTISPEMLEQIEKIDDSNIRPGKVWTAEEDAILIKYWPIKNKDQLSEMLGVSDKTARARYKKLTRD